MIVGTNQPKLFNIDQCGGCRAGKASRFECFHDSKATDVALNDWKSDFSGGPSNLGTLRLSVAAAMSGNIHLTKNLLASVMNLVFK